MLEKILGGIKPKNGKITLDEAAALLKTDKKALEAFETAYQDKVLLVDPDPETEQLNAKQASALKEKLDAALQTQDDDSTAVLNDLITRIVNELVAQTKVYTYSRGTAKISVPRELPEPESLVSMKDLKPVAKELRPDLTGTLMRVDITETSFPALLYFYQQYLKEKNPKKKKHYYDMFRAGLDLLDLDDVIYEIIGRNKNSMGFWFPKLVEAAKEQSFFKIPETCIAKVPMTLLQLTKLDYGMLSPTSLKIVDRWAVEVFNLNMEKEYFIKTGTFSSKYDFRNAHVYGQKEVKELGEYLLFIHNQAISMASFTNTPSIYGVSTTVEWVVREFIQNKDNAPAIYKGLPLHTEYRVFVDCDTDQVLCIVPYWDPKTMKNRFTSGMDANSPHQRHDYVTFSAYEDVMMQRYEENKENIVAHVATNILPWLDLTGQWSLDIMQNGDDFWLIDMALAEQSFFYDHVPEGLRRPSPENWLPTEINEN